MPHIEMPPEPWLSFFAEVDSRLSEEVQVHCCGGFVVTQLYRVARTTSDIDFLSVVPNIESELMEIAGKGSATVTGRNAARELRGNPFQAGTVNAITTTCGSSHARAI
jgi:hypothetical protein